MGAWTRRKWIAVAAVLALFVTAIGVAAEPEFQGFPTVRVMADGEEISGEIPPILFYGRTLVPLRYVATAFDAELGWDDTTRTVTITRADATAQRQTENELLYYRNQNIRNQGLLAEAQAEIEILTAASADLREKVESLTAEHQEAVTELEQLRGRTGGLWAGLTSQQIETAISYGESRRNLSRTQFTSPWSRTVGDMRATVFSQFLAVADRARTHSVGRLSVAEAREGIQVYSSRQELAFHVEVLGNSVGFATAYNATLQQQDLVLIPTAVHHAEAATPSRHFPDPPAYQATNTYHFSYDQLDLDAPVTLLVQGPDDQVAALIFDLRYLR